MIAEETFWELLRLTDEGDVDGIREWMVEHTVDPQTEFQVFVTLPRFVAIVWTAGIDEAVKGEFWAFEAVDDEGNAPGPEQRRAAEMIAAALNDDGPGLAGYAHATLASPPEFVGGVLAGLIAALSAGLHERRVANQD